MITSTANPHIKSIRKLNDSKERGLTNTFLAEGLRVVGQAFDSHAQILELIISDELLISEYGKKLVRRAEKEQSITVTQVSPEVFASLARKDKPQGIAAVIRQKWSDLTEFRGLTDGVLVSLESVQNPGNLGTILRTCDAVGVRGLLLLDHSTDPYDPAAIKASMGAIFTVPIARTNLEELQQFLKSETQISPLGTSDKAERDYYDTRYPDPILLMMGSEREGLSPEYARLCRNMVSIPMLGACDSLNLSVATGIMLYQIHQSHKRNL